MSRMQFSLAAAAVVGASILGLGVDGRSDEPAPTSGAAKAASTEKPASKEESDKWMHIKLKASQEIFAGLTHGDAKKIEDNSRRMLVLNLLEQWRRDNDFTRQSEYDAQLNAFEYATKELIRTSHDKDIGGALDAYVLLSKSCVKCHQLIRDVPTGKQ
jgi:hypothetical protein